ncbi:MAG: 6-bladed beta-propeller [Bacteroidales bacterium]|nr:6-bladed beta-propeller [Bacteroidales bacterium]
MRYFPISKAILPFFLLIPLVIGCKNRIDKPAIKTTTIHSTKSIDRISDSVFFTLIGKMSGVDEIIMLDVTQKRLLVCDRQLKLKKVISRMGKGPGELIYPASSYSINGRYYVCDNNELKEFNSDGIYLRSLAIPKSYNTTRFFVSQNGTVFCNSGVTSDKPLCAVDRNGTQLFSFGTRYEIEGSKLQKKVCQARNLFSYGNNKIISIGNSFPSFEIYSLQGKLINSQQIDDPIVMEDYKNVLLKQSEDPSVSLELFLDVFVHGSTVYFLSSLKLADGTIKYYLIIGEIESDRLVFRRHLEIASPDEDASWNDLFVLDDSTVIIYELNTMSFNFFKINP